MKTTLFQACKVVLSTVGIKDGDRMDFCQAAQTHIIICHLFQFHKPEATQEIWMCFSESVPGAAIIRPHKPEDDDV